MSGRGAIPINVQALASKEGRTTPEVVTRGWGTVCPLPQVLNQRSKLEGRMPKIEWANHPSQINIYQSARAERSPAARYCRIDLGLRPDASGRSRLRRG